MNLQRKSNGESYAPCTFPATVAAGCTHLRLSSCHGTLINWVLFFFLLHPRNKPVEFLPSLATAANPFSRDQVGIDV